MAHSAQGSPTKDFFVRMLTRDIDLNDSILDLLDNCLDGVVRQKELAKKEDSVEYYKNYYAHINISESEFLIEDNCGGIPREVAEKYAFRMGRSSEKSDEELPTVGIYGIGMKRAIFKIGRSAEVITRNASQLYKVIIPIGWESDGDNWDFPIEDLEDSTVLPEGGTIIKISNINSGVKENWDSDDKKEQFIDKIIKAIQQSYSFIIKKGFKIDINEKVVNSLPINLLFAKGTSATIQPYMYQQEFGDVYVSLAVGFYAPTPSPDELDDEATMKRSTADAGWTVICNDRVVLYNDKTHLTGWGEAGVPQYHTQFIGIRGIVIFKSSNPQNLPMTTTKRGIDTSSSIYAVVKDRMREGLKIFTSYTNKWKGRNEEEREYSNKASEIAINELTDTQAKIEATTDVKFKKSRNGYVYKPNLPKPKTDRPYKRISFCRDEEEINIVKELLYSDRDIPITPSQVGEKCFDIVLSQAKDSKEGE